MASKRYQHVLDINVLEAARERMAEAFDLFDSIVVSYSGGKDSQTCLYLAKEEAEKRGRLPLDVLFIDEEVIPDEVVDHVDRVRRLDWVRMRWLCWPMRSEVGTLNVTRPFTQWGTDREPDRWVRPMPEWGERHPDRDTPRGTLDVNADVASRFPGSVGIVVGLRAKESLFRFRAVMVKKNQPHIATAWGSDPSLGYRLVRPIYDWEESDVFRYMRETGAPWCPAYELMSLGGARLRVATPMHAEGARHDFGGRTLRRCFPELYRRIVEVWPEVQLEERYRKDYSASLALASYKERGWQGCRDYIEDKVPSESKDLAYRRLFEYQEQAGGDLYKGSPDRFLKYLSKGSLKRPLQRGM